MTRPVRVLIAKLGLDGHDRGAKVVTAALRDAGFEVVYSGLHQTPEMIARAAADEDVGAVGVSLLSGAHLTLLPRLRRLLDEAGQPGVLLFAGGIIPEADRAALAKAGVLRVFGPGTMSAEYIAFLREALDRSADSGENPGCGADGCAGVSGAPHSSPSPPPR